MPRAGAFPRSRHDRYLRLRDSGDERLWWEPASPGRRLRVLFAGPDFRFIESIALRLGRLRNCEVRTLRWRGIGAAAPATAVAIVTAIVSGLLACCSGSSPGAGHVPGISPQAMADALHPDIEADRARDAERIVNRLQNEEQEIMATEQSLADAPFY